MFLSVLVMFCFNQEDIVSESSFENEFQTQFLAGKIVTEIICFKKGQYFYFSMTTLHTFLVSGLINCFSFGINP